MYFQKQHVVCTSYPRTCIRASSSNTCSVLRLKVDDWPLQTTHCWKFISSTQVDWTNTNRMLMCLNSKPQEKQYGLASARLILTTLNADKLLKDHFVPSKMLSHANRIVQKERLKQKTPLFVWIVYGRCQFQTWAGIHTHNMLTQLFAQPIGTFMPCCRGDL